jgi:hypothetical protein
MDRWQFRILLILGANVAMKSKVVMIAGLLWVLSSASAFACRGPFPPFEKNIAMAKTVFAGRIVSVNQTGKEKKTFETTFEVGQVWKGKVGKTIIVVSTNNSCDFAGGGSRQIGEKWLILSGETGPKIGTSLLSGNVLLESKDGQSSGEKIPALVEKELGKGHAPVVL